MIRTPSPVGEGWGEGKSKRQQTLWFDTLKKIKLTPNFESALSFAQSIL